LFAPKFQTPIKTLDLPVGGKIYGSQTLPLILDFVNIVSKIDANSKSILDDDTGEVTLRILKDVRKVAYKLNSNHPSSLGLHPAVYFYSQEGRHKPASLFAIIDFVMELDKLKKINDFIDVRSTFEDFILEYDYLIQQIYRKYRSAQKSYPYISKFFLKIVANFKSGKTIDESIKEIAASSDFSYLGLQNISQQSDSTSKDFSTNQKSAIYMRDALRNAPTCKICGGLIHRNSISIDHTQRKQDGGLATLENGQLTHPYCNTGYKN
jgi:HNH endonuclease